MKQLFLFLALITLGALNTLQARPQFPVATEELRLEGAQAHLTGKPNQVAVYARGLVCSSCGIGLRIHIGKLDGLDESALDEGMQLDAKNQLVLIAYKADHGVDTDAVYKAVHKAGYEPTHYYQWDGQSVQIHTFKEAK